MGTTQAAVVTHWGTFTPVHIGTDFKRRVIVDYRTDFEFTTWHREIMDQVRQQVTGVVAIETASTASDVRVCLPSRTMSVDIHRFLAPFFGHLKAVIGLRPIAGADTMTPVKAANGHRPDGPDAA